MNKIVIVRENSMDWVAIYINGRLEWQGHLDDFDYVLFMQWNGLDVEARDNKYREYLKDNRRFPDMLTELQT